MMFRVRAFVGPAGCGKTYALMGEIERLCAASTFHPTQTVLAITFMHGSRRRLTARLHECPRCGVPMQCETIDSFCLRIVNRFRRYLNREKRIAIQADSQDDGWKEHDREWRATFRTIRKAAIELLRCSTVRSAIGFAHPIIIVDEFQDCEGELLDLIGLLTLASTVVVAADTFQHLSDSDTCPASQWLQEQAADTVALTGNRRTSDSVLHETAAALREGRNAVSSIEVFAADGAALAAWNICAKLAWKKVPAGTSKVLISPVRLLSSPWIQQVLQSLEKGFDDRWHFRPSPFRWESGEGEQYAAALDAVVAQIGSGQYVDRSNLQALRQSEHQIVRLGASQGRRLLSVRGEDRLDASEFYDIVRMTSHSASAFRREGKDARIALTVHGAKNREWDYVFIVWPFQVRNDPLFKRKLLYNAVTRAREGAFLFVQGGEKRIGDDPTLALLKCGVVKRKQKTSWRRSKNR